jgi:CBS domain-containing protein
VSPRAAARLAGLGFTEVYDYVAGKADWGSAGLPLEGENPSSRRASASMRTDAPTCGPDDRLQDVRARLGEWDTCFVLDADGVLIGRLGRAALSSDDDVSADEAMTDGPSTIRPSARLEWSLTRMEKNDLTNLPVTSSDGRFLGLLTREDAEAVL